MKRALVCLLLALALAANAETITGRVVGVADGDTINGLRAKGKTATQIDSRCRFHVGRDWASK